MFIRIAFDVYYVEIYKRVLLMPHLICLAVVLRMISFGCDYCWSLRSSQFDHKKHMQRCQVCYSGKTCYFALQERALIGDKYTLLTYLCYLTYAPLYIAGPIVSYNAFAAQVNLLSAIVVNNEFQL
jgi:D-alanyl-lipoteichoic acid acyltransferase DltB (MBOAT superfamily)